MGACGGRRPTLLMEARRAGPSPRETGAARRAVHPTTAAHSERSVALKGFWRPERFFVTRYRRAHADLTATRPVRSICFASARRVAGPGAKARAGLLPPAGSTGGARRLSSAPPSYPPEGSSALGVSMSPDRRSPSLPSSVRTTRSRPAVASPKRRPAQIRLDPSRVMRKRVPHAEQNADRRLPPGRDPGRGAARK